MSKVKFTEKDAIALRKKAEKKLKKQKSIELSDLDSLKLHHELEVYKIELDMQNEELASGKEVINFYQKHAEEDELKFFPEW